MAAGLLITAAAVVFHWIWSRYAGALWRDEVVSYAVATKPTLAELWGSLKFDSFPGLLHFVLRGWIGAHLPSTDAGLRIFGLLVGLAILGALWWNARILGLRAPLVSLALFAMSPLSIWTTDSLRSYGLGIVCTLVAFGAMWKVASTESPPWKDYGPESSVGTKTAFKIWVAVAASASILSVHCLYQNAFFLLAICAGGFAVSITRRLWTRSALIVAIGGVAALTLIPYRRTMHEMGELRALIPHGLTFERIGAVLAQALGSSGRMVTWVWLGAFALGLFAATMIVLRGGEASPVSKKHRGGEDVSRGPGADRRIFEEGAAVQHRSDAGLVLYAVTILVIGSLGYLLFLKILSMPTQAWYYVPPIALAAICLEAILAVVSGARDRTETGPYASGIPSQVVVSEPELEAGERSSMKRRTETDSRAVAQGIRSSSKSMPRRSSAGAVPDSRAAARGVRLAVCLAVAGVSMPAVWTGVRERQTNVDLVAAQVETDAKAEDMIIVYPWYCGATFARYYTGKAFWTTLPPHSDLTLQRLDLLRDQMIKPDPIRPILERIEATLRSGNRVFLVGGLPFPQEGQKAPHLPPAPNATTGWDDSPYVMSWGMQAGDFLRTHALGAKKLPKVPDGGAVNPFEDLEVYVVTGWRPS